ncbi:MAG: tRNA (N6-isopentenyl adenosine(37)-C2)-methylthiotransferase MiaB [Chloroflexota bacterium]
MKYHIWTIGCQMNVADSRRVASTLEKLGYEEAQRVDDADVIVLNTCVVRQSAEDKAYGHLTSLRPIKKRKPNVVINLMGCMVGVKDNEALQKKFPYVDVFSAPSDPSPLIEHLTGRQIDPWTLDGEYVLPKQANKHLVAAHVPVVYGCSHACTFCVIPYRRGIERSRPLNEVLAEVRGLAEQDVKEVTLLGQIVDRYGKDLSEEITLPVLLRKIHDIDGIERIRFLTSHPNWMTHELLETVAELPKVMPHIEVPVQSGDDEVLANMHRGYTVDEYRRLIEQIRTIIPGSAIANDIIVGFPGENEEQFQHTCNMVAELRLDVVHLARYSERPGTVAARRMGDDVPEAEKWRRFRLIEYLQENIATEINARYLGQKVEVLFEEKVKGRWMGRTPTNKLVFAETQNDLTGQILPVEITWTGPWSMQGKIDLLEHENAGSTKPKIP